MHVRVRRRSVVRSDDAIGAAMIRHVLAIVLAIAACKSTAPSPTTAHTAARGFDRDGDRDGIPDELDTCPADAEVYNGRDDEDGCPDQLRIPLVRVSDQMTPAFAFSKGAADRSVQLIAALEGWMIQIRRFTPSDLVCFAYATDDEPRPSALARRRARLITDTLVELGATTWRVWACSDVRQPHSSGDQRIARCYLEQPAPEGCKRVR
jgi:hypothetical protein